MRRAGLNREGGPLGAQGGRPPRSASIMASRGTPPWRAPPCSMPSCQAWVVACPAPRLSSPPRGPSALIPRVTNTGTRRRRRPIPTLGYQPSNISSRLATATVSGLTPISSSAPHSGLLSLRLASASGPRRTPRARGS